jgi:GNAT superfamily N-acetyltransferase
LEEDRLSALISIEKGVFMLLIRRAGLTDIPKIRRCLNEVVNYKNNFYSEPLRGILFYILKKSCYIISKNEVSQGIIVIKNVTREVFYYPFSNAVISFPKLIYLLKNYFDLSKYKIKLRYRKIDVNICKKFFSFKILNDVKYMYMDICAKHVSGIEEKENLSIRQAKINNDEGYRVVLQNKIFSHIIGRKELTLQEVLNEQNDPKFLKDLCFILEEYSIPIGYGQILMFDELYFLVNFGIVSEYRGGGYGYYFLSKILSSCLDHGIDELYLSVDSSNISAIKLYEKVGFQEIYNSITIEL